MMGFVHFEPRVQGMQVHEPWSSAGATCGWQSLTALLWQAWRKVEQNAGAPGIDHVSVKEFAKRSNHEISLLRQQLADQSYRPKGLREVQLVRPGRKSRQLSIPVVRDRIIHTALALKIGPNAEARFCDNSHGYRAGRGVNSALVQCQTIIDSGARWIVDADIQDFFPRIQRSLLLKELPDWIPDPSIQRLLEQWLMSPLLGSPLGLPMGSAISPLLANMYLHPVDQALRAEGVAHVRYADDMLLFLRDEHDCRKAHALLGQLVALRGLSLNEEKTRIVHAGTAPLRFLGAELGGATHPDGCRTVWTTVPKGLDVEVQTPLVSLPTATVNGALHTTPGEAECAIAAAQSSAPAQGYSYRASAAVPGMRTLYVMRQGSRVKRDGERVCVVLGSEVLISIPIREIDAVQLYGNVGLTSGVLALLLAHGVRLAVIDHQHRCLGQLSPARVGGTSVLLQQVAMHLDAACSLKIARAMTVGKIVNSISVIHRAARNHGHLDLVAVHLRAARQTLDQCRSASNHQALRGLEGFAARSHFAAMRALLGSVWGFENRLRRPAPDPVNAMLDLGYSILARTVETSLAAHGLVVELGFMHRPRGHKPALACDLMEEFRAPVIDSLVIQLCVNRRVELSDFECHPESGCRFVGSAYRKFIAALEAKFGMTESDDQQGYRQVIDCQVRHLMAVIGGQTTSYVPWRVR